MKYDKYFIHKASSSPLHPEGDFPGVPLMRIDDRYMKEGFYFECIWINGPITEREASKPHRHDCDEYLGFFGSNVEDPFNLNAEVEFWFDDEKHVFDKNCVVFVPAKTWHSPIMISRIERPVFCLSATPVIKYTQEINRDPKWSHLREPIP